MLARHPAVTWLLALVSSAVATAAPGLVLSSSGTTVVRPHPHVFLAGGEGFTPRSGVSDGTYSGSLAVERAGQYTFHVASGNLLLDGEAVPEGPLALTAGAHSFEFSVSRGIGPLRAGIEWEGPGFEREPIPQRYFSHEPGPLGAQDGRMLFEDLGCGNCHRAEPASLTARRGPHLTGIGGRLKAGWIRPWLDAPDSFRPWATMPHMLGPRERVHVAAFLASLSAEPIEERQPRTSDSERGRTSFQSLGCVACHGALLQLSGLGSKMTPARLQRYLLDPYRHAPDGRMPDFHLSEAEAFDLAAYLALSRNTTFEAARTDAGDIREGRRLVVESGCLACHELDGLRSEASAPGLVELDPSKGCLANAVPAGLPRYSLADESRLQLRAFVRDFRESPDSAPSPVHDLPRRLSQLGCHACHELDGTPPTGYLAEVAPPLSRVGAKLRSGALERILQSRSHNLDWQDLRMPGYGSERAAWLADALAKAAGVDPGESPGPAPSGRASRGLDMLGIDGESGGMGCIGCHGWGAFPALGEDGPNLFDAGVRLRWHWFDRWMRSPARILAGTSMPSYFRAPADHPARAAIADLWAALRAAGELPAPIGFRPSDTEALPGSEARPIPRDKAVVIRWDMPEATPSAFAVGLPGGVSYCFDAGETRLRYAWRGGFVDMSRTLLSKKNRDTNLTETAEVVGEIFFREGPAPIRVGDRERLPQRRFLGYRLVDSVPEFRYTLDGMVIHERISPADGGLLRSFRIQDVDRPAWFVAAESDSADIRSTLEDEGRIPLGSEVRFEVRVLARP